MNELENELVLSVCMITYKHEAYIKEAIEGVLMQETNFEFHLILADDCSPDATPQIVQHIIDAHPRGYRIKYFRHDKNIGMQPNGLFALQQCKGKYVALCDGDDYWTDPLKLQKQVDFLEENLDYVIHSGSAKIAYSKELVSENIIGNTGGITDYAEEDFYTRNNLVTCTVMFRNILSKYPDTFDKITFGDWFLYLILLHQSKSKSFVSNTVFSVYRVHEEGVMKKLTKIEKIDMHFQQIKTLQEYIGYEKKSKKDINNINGYFRNKFMILLEEKLYLKGFKSLMININECGFQTNLISYIKLSIKQFIRV